MKSSRSSGGFTLVEVLVALTIVIVAFMAMFGSMMQVVAASTLMQEKTLASWIAYDRITELRISGEFPEDDEKNGEIEMAGVEWTYRIRFIATASDNIKQVVVRVAPANDPDNYLGIATGVITRFGPANGQNNPGGIRQ